MTKRRALLTGISGQDGSHLAEFLLNKDYEVHGIVRRSSNGNLTRLTKIIDQVTLHHGDLTDQTSLDQVVQQVQPDEVYNLGAQSFVGSSWGQPVATAEMTGLGAVRMLEAVRRHAPAARFYQASSSEMFGKVQQVPQTEQTPFWPRSPYGVAKVYGHWITVNYRESYNLYACSGILYNHEGERRGYEFVTRKITRAVARIAAGLQQTVKLGNLDAKRDWGYAGDYVEAMWLMLQQEFPDDYVIATGEAHTVREFCELAFDRVGLDWTQYVEIDQTLFRPAEVDLLLGDPTKARTKLKWRPKTNFAGLVALMVDADLAELAKSGHH